MADNGSGMNAVVAIVAIIVIAAVAYFGVMMLRGGTGAGGGDAGINIDLPDGGGGGQ